MDLYLNNSTEKNINNGSMEIYKKYGLRPPLLTTLTRNTNHSPKPLGLKIDQNSELLNGKWLRRRTNVDEFVFTRQRRK